MPDLSVSRLFPLVLLVRVCSCARKCPRPRFRVSPSLVCFSARNCTCPRCRVSPSIICYPPSSSGLCLFLVCFWCPGKAPALHSGTFSFSFDLLLPVSGCSCAYPARKCPRPRFRVSPCVGCCSLSLLVRVCSCAHAARKCTRPRFPGLSMFRL